MDNTTPDQKTFSVLDFVSEIAYPTQSVKIYTDVATGKKLADLRYKMENSEEAGEADEAEIESLTEKVEDTSLTFDLRGFAPGVVDDIINQATDKGEEPDEELVAKTIVRTSSRHGHDEHLWTAEEVHTLRRAIPEGEWAKLLTGTAGVLFTAAVFDRAVDAGFPGGRADVAAEL